MPNPIQLPRPFYRYAAPPNLPAPRRSPVPRSLLRQALQLPAATPAHVHCTNHVARRVAKAVRR